MIAAALTSVPGSSAVVRGGIVSYATEIKTKLLAVDPTTIERDGVVSERTAREMAHGARVSLDADVVVAVTGIAGPSGAQDGKPVGTVCFGVEAGSVLRSCTRRFDGGRDSVRQQTVAYALEALLEAVESL